MRFGAASSAKASGNGTWMAALPNLLSCTPSCRVYTPTSLRIGHDAAMTECVTAPYGAWPSPIGASDVARANIHLSFPTVASDQVWWQELRPEEGGRTTVVYRAADGRRAELLSAPWNARTRVHEYGGRSYLPVPAKTAGQWAIVFANHADQRLYVVSPAANAGAPGAAAAGEGPGALPAAPLTPAPLTPAPLTPEPTERASLRYADFVLSPDRSEVWCVRET